MNKLGLLFAALSCMSGFTTTVNAVGINIEVGDRPYYIHGPRYWAGGALLVLGSRALGLASPPSSLDPRTLPTLLMTRRAFSRNS